MNAIARFLDARCDAATELWHLGYVEESYVVAHDGLCRARDELRESARQARPLHDALAALDALIAEASQLGVPTDRRGFTREHASWLERAREAMRRTSRQTTDARRQRARTWLAWLGSVALAIASCLALLHELQGHLHATASAQYSLVHVPRRVADGRADTEWLLPDGTAGYVDVALATRRPVHGVTLRNAANAPYFDRAARTALVLVFDGDRVVDRASVDFEAFEKAPKGRRVALAGQRATHVRVQVLTHHGLGGGLAEVSID